MRTAIWWVLGAVLTTTPARAQATLLKDIHTGPAPVASSSPRGFTTFGGFVYFSALEPARSAR